MSLSFPSIDVLTNKTYNTYTNKRIPSNRIMSSYTATLTHLLRINVNECSLVTSHGQLNQKGLI